MNVAALCCGVGTARDVPLMEQQEQLDANLHVHPQEVTPDSCNEITELKGLEGDKLQNKVEEIRAGGSLKERMPPFQDDDRSCQDVLWAVLFVCIFVGVAGYAAVSVDEIYAHVAGSAPQQPLVRPTAMGMSSPENSSTVVIQPVAIEHVATAGFAAFLAAIAAALAYFWAAQAAPSIVLYFSFIAGPLLAMLVGAAMVAVDYSTFGALQSEEPGSEVMYGGQGIVMVFGILIFIMGMLFACRGGCILCCVGGDRIQFSIDVLEMVSHVMAHNPCIVAVAMIGSFLSTVWSVLFLTALAGVYIKYSEQMEAVNDHDVGKKVVVFVTALIWTFGAQVSHFVCHVTYCGVFGRWYYQHPTMESPLLPSLKVALTTSFGSICMGSFLIAVIEAVQAVVRQMRQEANNPVVCVLLLVVECFIGCIGDILEYFSSWAYVQCAVRGCSFTEAARITYSMMTCANVKYILTDLVIDQAAAFGMLVCAIVSSGVGGAVGMGFATDDGYFVPALGVAIGFFCGMGIGACTLAVVSSGTKTILACWADEPRHLRLSNEYLHSVFVQKIQDGKRKEEDEDANSSSSFRR